MLFLLFWLSTAQADFPSYEYQGFLTGELHPKQAAGNSLLFSSEKIAYLHDRNLIIWKDVNDFYDLMKSCQIEFGLLRRTPAGTPFSEDEEAQDDYIGVSAASYLLNTSHAQEILNYGIRHDFYYSIHGLRDWAIWFGRYPAFLAHIKWAAGIEPSYFQKFAWAVTIATSGILHPEAQDPWILSWLMIKTMNGRSLLPRLAAAFWNWRMTRQWGTLEAVFARYFGDARHPLAQVHPRFLGCPTEMFSAFRSSDLTIQCKSHDQ